MRPTGGAASLERREDEEGDRLLLTQASQDLLDRARRERGTLPAGSRERRFLLGVDAAASEVIHPELTKARSDDWLSREDAEFRDGYLKTAATIASARASHQFPTSMRLPQLDGWPART